LSTVTTGRDKMVETVKLSKNTHERLTAYAKWGETLDIVINRVLDELEDCKKGIKNKRQTITLHTEREDNLNY
jgi:hypothetical protein